MISILGLSFISTNWFSDLFNIGEDSKLRGILSSLKEGYITEEDLGEFENISVFRLVEENSIKLSIVSNENVLAIQENFSSPDCNVLNYSSEPEIDILVFKNSENTWILANKNNLILNLNYTLEDSCSVVSGTYFFISEDEIQNTSENGDVGEDGNGDGTEGGNGDGGGNGGSGTSSPSEPKTSTGEIIEVGSEEELTDVMQDEPKQTSTEIEVPKKTYNFWVAFLILAIITVVFLIVSNLNKQKIKKQKKRKGK
tara:strand:- start:19837 stop:20601 length:765 start_codon:yes stop_codon:yes gene_type:complete